MSAAIAAAAVVSSGSKQQNNELLGGTQDEKDVVTTTGVAVATKNMRPLHDAEQQQDTALMIMLADAEENDNTLETNKNEKVITTTTEETNITTTTTAVSESSSTLTGEETKKAGTMIVLATMPTKKPTAVSSSTTTSTTSTTTKQSKQQASWEENFQKLMEYKEMYGTCDLIRGTMKCERFSNLGLFVSNERQRIKRVQRLEQENPKKITENEKERVRRLLDLGFVLERGTEAKEVAKKSFFWDDKKTAAWEANFESMKRFKEQHGTCKGKKNMEGWNPQLSKWSQEASKQIRLYYEENDDKCTLDEERINRLKELGITPALALAAPRNSKKYPPWEEMYEQLKQYGEEHGHFNVPAVHPYTALRSWIALQRRQYKDFKAGKKKETSSSSSHQLLTPDRLSLLLKAGLRMQVGATVRKTFDERATEWLEYKAKHGRDPPGDEPGVGKWCRRMRKCYELMQKGENNNSTRRLTQQQFEQLTAWGFTWTTGMKKPEYRCSKKCWNDRYQQLVEYKQQNGHVNVPQLYPILGNWVHRQRKEYSDLKRGKKSRLTPEKIEKLRSVGFVFLTRKSRLENEERRRDMELGLMIPEEDVEEDEKKENDKAPNNNDDDFDYDEGFSDDDDDEGFSDDDDEVEMDMTTYW